MCDELKEGEKNEVSGEDGTARTGGETPQNTALGFLSPPFSEEVEMLRRKL